MTRGALTQDDIAREWSKLEKLGVPLEPPQYRVACGSVSGLVIEQNSIDGNMLLELDNGATACILDVDILCYGGGKIIITERILELPWVSAAVEWLPHVDSIGNMVEMYDFPGERQLAYPRDAVINDRVGKRGVLSRGDQITGLLLGVCWEPIPDRYRNGCNVSVQLQILDQFHRHYFAQLTLQMFRSARAVRRKLVKQPRASLFSECDYRIRCTK